MQHKNSIRQYSRKLKPAGTLAAQVRLLREFANLRDEDADKFGAAHPDFVLSKNLTEEGWDEGVIHRIGGGGPRLVSARALAIAETIRKLQPNPALRKREMLRLIWKRDEGSNDYLKVLLAGQRVVFDWNHGEIVYGPENDFERALYALFRNSARAKVCANPDCPAPYFVASRRSERYCSEDCAGLFQKEWKRKWWKEKGSQLRRAQRAVKRSTKKGGKG